MKNISKNILKTANGEQENGFCVEPNFNIRIENNEFLVYTNIKLSDNTLLPISSTNKNLSIAIIHLYKFLLQKKSPCKLIQEPSLN
jgi:hypothetical protein